MTFRSRTLGAALVVALALGACAVSSDIDAQGDRSRAGKKADGKAGKAGKKDGNPSSKQTSDAAGGVAGELGTPGSVSGEGAPKGFESGAGGGIDPSLARASAVIEEPDPDARKQGVTPDYAEVVEAAIQGIGKNFRMTLTFAGNVPERMPNDKTYMVVGFAITGNNKGKKEDSYAFGANATDKGWDTYAGAKGEARKFPGTFRVTGNQIVMELPWSYVRGPRSFKWFSNSSWFAQLANTSHYSFDPAPNEEAATFPGA